MNIRILGVGDTKLDYLKDGETDFLDRITHYATMKSEWVKPPKIGKNETADHIRKKEAEILFSRFTESSFVVALDVSGIQTTSEAFAKTISDWMSRSIREVVFMIGGPFGLDASLLRRANQVLSLSKMTFTHDMTRLILLEQIYRALTILKGEKYHK